MPLSINREHQEPETTIPFFAQSRLFAPLPPTGMLTLLSASSSTPLLFSWSIKIGTSVWKDATERLVFFHCMAREPTWEVGHPQGSALTMFALSLMMSSELCPLVR